MLATDLMASTLDEIPSANVEPRMQPRDRPLRPIYAGATVPDPSVEPQKDDATMFLGQGKSELPDPVVTAGTSALALAEPVIEIHALRYAVAGRSIFSGLDFNVARGKVTAIMGQSGTGKTTLLRLITGQTAADSGSILVGGRELHKLSRAALYSLRRRMGMLFQNSALLTDLDVFENVAFPLREHTDLPERLIRQLVLMKLQAVGLRGASRLMPAELSGGMARRVALARAIVMDPEILLYDEPFVGLDPISLGVILRLIRRLNDALGLTSIVVSHDVQAVSQIADVLCLLSQGKIVSSGTPEEMRFDRSDTVRQFMEGNLEGPVPFHHSAPNYFNELLGGPASGEE
jgi:phospholipid/cholesterol/gamma-HCH transport system ATP-binding protein